MNIRRTRTVAAGMLAASLVALATGCSADQDFSFAMEHTMTVSDTVNLTLSTQMTVDPRDTWTKFGSIAGDLTAMRLDGGATITIVRDSGDSGKTLNALLRVSTVGGADYDTIWSAPNFVIDSSINTPFPLVLSDADSQRLANRFRQSPNTATLAFTATANHTPNGFKVVVRLPLRGTYTRGL